MTSTPVEHYSYLCPNPNATPAEKLLDKFWDFRRKAQVATAIHVPSYVAAEKHFHDFLRGRIPQLEGLEDDEPTLICGSYIIPRDPSDALSDKVILRLKKAAQECLKRYNYDALKWGNRTTGMLIFNDGHREVIDPGVGFRLSGGDEHGGLKTIVKVYTFYVFGFPAEAGKVKA